MDRQHVYGCMVHPINTERGKRDFYETVIICILGGHRLPINFRCTKETIKKEENYDIRRIQRIGAQPTAT